MPTAYLPDEDQVLARTVNASRFYTEQNEAVTKQIEKYLWKMKRKRRYRHDHNRVVFRTSTK